MASEPHSAAYFNDQRDFWFNDDWLHLVARRLRLDQVRRALDVGAGQGHWTLLLAPLLAPDAELWERRLAEARRTAQALREERLDSAGGHIHYLICGRRP